MRGSVLAAVGVTVLALAACRADSAPVRFGTTTSVQDSGLLDVLIPVYAKASGARVDVIAVGTGAAFKLARDGNVDLLLVHDPEGEDDFIAAGDGLSRHEIMWNTFEILGPPGDPAAVSGLPSASAALARIAGARAAFLSRGDDSGTHRREKRLWEAARGRPEWPGYREAGQGMGATLRIADELGAYVLTDRGSRLGYKGSLRLVPLLADSPDLRNRYSVVLINPAKHPDLNHEGARRLAGWLRSAATAQLIENYRVGGQPLFHPVSSGR